MNCKWVLSGGSGSKIRQNQKIHKPHKITHHAQQNTAHETTQRNGNENAEFYCL
jgi:hypothetical protein